MSPLPPSRCHSHLAGAAAGVRSDAPTAVRPAPRPQRWASWASTALLAGLLMGCGTAEPPATRLYRLPLAASNAPAAADPAAARQATPRWQLLQPIELPELIDRDALVLPDGATGVLRPSGHQWAEPLREAVPRVLWHDLGQRLGADTGVLGLAPPGWPVQVQVKLSLLALESAPDQATVQLVARWSIASPTGEPPARLGQASLVAPVRGSGPRALVQAHRDALAMLAQRLADDLRRWPTP